MTSPRMSRRVGLVALLSSVCALACGGDGGTAPGADARGIRVVSGGAQTDTVGALLAQPLIVEVRDSTGRVMPGIAVRFTASPTMDTFLTPGRAFVLVSPVDPPLYGSSTQVVSDAQGRASALVWFSVIAGTPQVIVSVPLLGVSDTVTFTAKPGAPRGIQFSRIDTVVQPGATYSLNAMVTDRPGNVISGAIPTYRGVGVASVSASGQVTVGMATTRAKIVVSYRDAVDSASVTVFPKVPMVVSAGNQVALINSDGTGFTSLATTPNVFFHSPHGVKTTTSVVYQQGIPSFDSRIWIVSPGLAPRLLTNNAVSGEAWPRFSPDGAWVYFVRPGASLWRIRPDGTGLDSLTAVTPLTIYGAPSVSPDGRTVAIEDTAGVKLIDVASRTSRIVRASCGAPRYSPDGASFACYSQHVVSVMKTDGTGVHVLNSLDTESASTTEMVSAVDWTPDGEWLLLYVGNRGQEIVRASDGLRAPLSMMLPGYVQASFVR